jgi:hypothetical protein
MMVKKNIKKSIPKKVISKQEVSSKKSSIKAKKKTIGDGLINVILDTKKIKINNVEVSKKAFENLALFASNLKPAMTIEQAISSLLEQGFNPKFNPKKIHLLP